MYTDDWHIIDKHIYHIHTIAPGDHIKLSNKYQRLYATVVSVDGQQVLAKLTVYPMGNVPYSYGDIIQCQLNHIQELIKR